jgi:hypothetical protein
MKAVGEDRIRNFAPGRKSSATDVINALLTSSKKAKARLFCSFVGAQAGKPACSRLLGRHLGAVALASAWTRSVLVIAGSAGRQIPTDDRTHALRLQAQKPLWIDTVRGLPIAEAGRSHMEKSPHERNAGWLMSGAGFCSPAYNNRSACRTFS